MLLGLLLLGFKSLKELEPHYQVTHPYFIYPDESVSSEIFHDIR
jgi:hypothetical protein